MEWIIISLLSLSALLFILSFFQKNPTAGLEKQVENLSVQLMQEIYFLKKKIRILEEEYMIEHSMSEGNGRKLSDSGSLSRDDVLALYEEGYSVEEIASLTSSNIDYIEELLAN